MREIPHSSDVLRCLVLRASDIFFSNFLRFSLVLLVLFEPWSLCDGPLLCLYWQWTKPDGDHINPFKYIKKTEMYIKSMAGTLLLFARASWPIFPHCSGMSGSSSSISASEPSDSRTTGTPARPPINAKSLSTNKVVSNAFEPAFMSRTSLNCLSVSFVRSVESSVASAVPLTEIAYLCQFTSYSHVKPEWMLTFPEELVCTLDAFEHSMNRVLLDTLCDFEPSVKNLTCAV